MSRAGGANRLRVIGGSWRGRRLGFPSRPGLRPTPDRVRETLFNWLQPVITGSRCLDLFAGSGVLGFEAASRGSSSVVMVERDRQVTAMLETNRQLLDAGQITVITGDAIPYLAQCHTPFDVVFVDPPYASRLAAQALHSLSERQLVRSQGYVYLEQSRHSDPVALDERWIRYRETHAGEVHGLLLRPAWPTPEAT